MDDLERTFREGLRDAAAKKPPLGPIDLGDVTTRPVGVVPPRRPARWLAAAAAVVLVAGIGAGAYALNGRGTVVPAVPAIPATTPSAVTLLGTSWLATAINGTQTTVDSAGHVPTLTFVTDVHGYGGQPCTDMDIIYALDGSRIEFKGPSTNNNDCASLIAAQQEHFWQALFEASSFRRSADTLELLDGAGRVVLTFASTTYRGPDPGIRATPGTTTLPPAGACQRTEVGSALHPNRVSVRVFGDGETGGLAKLTALHLRAYGFHVLSYSEEGGARAGTTIRGAAADSPEVKLVALLVPGAVVEGDGRSDHSVDVLMTARDGFVEDSNPSVPVSGPLCLPVITNAPVQVRLRNDSGVDFESVSVVFPGNYRAAYGKLAAGASSDYIDVPQAYRYAWVQVVASGSERAHRPADYVGGKELQPGLYTYGLTIDGDAVNIALTIDR